MPVVAGRTWEACCNTILGTDSTVKRINIRGSELQILKTVCLALHRTWKIYTTYRYISEEKKSENTPNYHFEILRGIRNTTAEAKF